MKCCAESARPDSRRRGPASMPIRSARGDLTGSIRSNGRFPATKKRLRPLRHRWGSGSSRGDRVESVCGNFSTSPHAVETLQNLNSRRRLRINIGFTGNAVTRRNHGACGPLGRFYIDRAVRRGRAGTRSLDHALRGEFERNFRGERRRNKGSGARRSGCALRLKQARPVACLVHADLAPRRAVRRVGPRPDPTRSARSGEPCGQGLAAWGWKPELPRPYRGRNSPCGGGRKKNGGSQSPDSV